MSKDEQGNIPLTGLGFVGITAVGACLPCIWCDSCFTVNEQEEVLVLRNGEYIGSTDAPGCHCFNGCCHSRQKVSKKVMAVDLPVTKVIDSNGNPVVVSAIVAYRVVQGKRAILDVDNVHQFVYANAQAVLKNVVAEYPYEHMEAAKKVKEKKKTSHDNDSDDDDDEDNTKSRAKHGYTLRHDADHISADLEKALQTRVDVAGVEVKQFLLNELSYASEIAAGMLKRQAAQAVVDARRNLVAGAVNISSDAVKNLQKQGVQLSPDAVSKMVTNLLTIICGQNEPEATVRVN